MSALIALLATLGASGSTPPRGVDGLDRPVAALWRARDGHVLVALAGGERLAEFDTGWQPIAAVNAPADGAESLHAYAGAWWCRDAAGRWWRAEHLADGFEPVAAPPAALLRLPAARPPGGRRLAVAPEAGSVAWSRADWEREPVVEWGPGWATVETRTAFTPPRELAWEDAAGRRWTVRRRIDRSDPLIARYHLEPIAAGEELRVYWLAGGSGAAIRLRVPAVEPAGPRPRVRLTAAAHGARE